MHPWAKRLLPQPRKILTDENFRSELTRALAQLGSTADLNHLDVSNVTSMKDAFRLMFFQGDISHWDVSNVEDMSGMFTQCSFNGDISKWNTRNVRTMAHMFQSSKFNGNISGWDTGRVTSMMRMFESSSFNGDVSRWDVQNVQTFQAMFQKSPFCGDVSKWKWANAAHVGYMFHETPWRGEVPFLRYRPGMEFSWFFSNEKAHEFREPNFYHWFLALAQPNNPDLRLDWKLFSQLVPTGPDLKEKARATCAIQDLWEKGAPVQQESFEHDFEGPA